MNGMAANAQLFANKVFYPGVKQIKTKTFNGTGIGKHWTLQRLDGLGRTIEEDNYRKKVLITKMIYEYNINNDKTAEITIFDINNNTRNDTTQYKYQYDRYKMITNQSLTYGNGNPYFTTYDLVGNVNLYRWTGK